MDIIKTYLENMFASLPKTKEVNKMKNDLLLNMEEKYLELKANGKTENEAVGIVISEFGNIEELALELGVNITNYENENKTLSIEEAKEYMFSVKKDGKLISFGVFLCILSPILIVIFAFRGAFDNNNTLNLIIGFVYLFVSIAIAVGLFITAGIDLDKYNYIKKEVFIPSNVKEYVKLEQKQFDPKFTKRLIVSVTMFILSPVLLITLGVMNDALGFEKYNLGIGVSILLGLVAIGCLNLISVALVKDSHNVLLEKGEYKKTFNTNEKIINAIASIYWPIVVIIYLLWSFTKGSWGISWIIWVIAGIIFGGISGAINAKDRN